MKIRPRLAAVFPLFRAPDVDDVEAAVLTRRFARGEGLATRVLRKNPDDPDVFFLYATALLARKQYLRIVREVEPRALALPKDKRVGHAFILTAAAVALGDDERAVRWAAELKPYPMFAGTLTDAMFASLHVQPMRDISAYA